MLFAMTNRNSMTQKEIYIAIDATLSELLSVVSAFNEKEFNTSIAAESWTPGQITQHVVLSISGFVELMKGPTQHTNRKVDEHVETIKNIFLNFTRKLKSPDFIIPEPKDYNKEDLLNTLRKLKSSLEEIIETADLDETCTAFGLPTLGNLTRQEALAFVIYHTKRHIHQLEGRRTTDHRPQTTRQPY